MATVQYTLDEHQQLMHQIAMLVPALAYMNARHGAGVLEAQQQEAARAKDEKPKPTLVETA